MRERKLTCFSEYKPPRLTHSAAGLQLSCRFVSPKDLLRVSSNPQATYIQDERLTVSKLSTCLQASMSLVYGTVDITSILHILLAQKVRAQIFVNVVRANTELGSAASNCQLHLNARLTAAKSQSCLRGGTSEDRVSLKLRE